MNYPTEEQNKKLHTLSRGHVIIVKHLRRNYWKKVLVYEIGGHFAVHGHAARTIDMEHDGTFKRLSRENNGLWTDDSLDKVWDFEIIDTLSEKEVDSLLGG